MISRKGAILPRLFKQWSDSIGPTKGLRYEYLWEVGHFIKARRKKNLNFELAIVLKTRQNETEQIISTIDDNNLTSNNVIN